MNRQSRQKLVRKSGISSGSKNRQRSGWLRRIAIGAACILVCFYCIIAVCLIGLKWVNPPATAVQIERRIGAALKGSPYEKRYRFVPLEHISTNLRHAVIAAEDARFFTHHGFDWVEVRASVDKALDGGKPRGASTITQQLVRNLFLSTQPSVIRKAVEFTIVPLAETILGKQRILALYLNVVEWGPGIYGAEAAARYYFHEPAADVNRAQALELAALLPAPLHRKPGHVEWYVAIIRTRMTEMGW